MGLGRDFQDLQGDVKICDVIVKGCSFLANEVLSL